MTKRIRRWYYPPTRTMMTPVHRYRSRSRDHYPAVVMRFWHRSTAVTTQRKSPATICVYAVQSVTKSP